MTVTEYKRRVIVLFDSGNATPQQWQEMAACVLDHSERKGELFPAAIDDVVMRGVWAEEFFGGNYGEDIERDATPKPAPVAAPTSGDPVRELAERVLCALLANPNVTGADPAPLKVGICDITHIESRNKLYFRSYLIAQEWHSRQSEQNEQT